MTDCGDLSEMKISSSAAAAALWGSLNEEFGSKVAPAL